MWGRGTASVRASAIVLEWWSLTQGLLKVVILWIVAHHACNYLTC